MIKKGHYYLLDENGYLDLKEYAPVIVRVTGKVGMGKYKCVPIEPVVYPCRKDGYMSKEFIIHKKYLTRYKSDMKIVIRMPENTPVFSDDDIEALKGISEIIHFNNKNLEKRVHAIIKKIEFYHKIGEHNG